MTSVSFQLHKERQIAIRQGVDNDSVGDKAREAGHLLPAWRVLQDPDSRLLLYARNLAAAVSSSRVPECVAGAERRVVSGGTPPDSTVRPPLPAARRQGTQSCGHSAIQADPRSTSSRRIAWTGTAL